MSDSGHLDVKDIMSDEALEDTMLKGASAIHTYLNQKVNRFCGIAPDPLYLQALDLSLQVIGDSSISRRANPYRLAIAFMVGPKERQSEGAMHVAKHLWSLCIDNPVHEDLYKVLGWSNDPTVDMDTVQSLPNRHNTSEAGDAILICLVSLILGAPWQSLRLRLYEGRCEFHYDDDLRIEQARDYVNIRQEGRMIATRVSWLVRNVQSITTGEIDALWDAEERIIQIEIEEIDRRVQASWDAFFENEGPEQQERLCEAFQHITAEISTKLEAQQHTIRQRPSDDHGVRFLKWPPRPE